MRCADLYTETDARNLRVFNWWTFAAAIVFVAATMLLSKKWVGLEGPAAIAVVAVTIVLLAGSVSSYLKFLREADELLRKIAVDALGAGFGAGVVFMLGYRLCERIGAPRLDVDDAVIVMMLFWGLGQYAAIRRYSAVEA